MVAAIGPALPHRVQRQVAEAAERSKTDKDLFADVFFGVKLYPWQKAAMASEGRVETWVAGRRTGKTLANTIDRTHDLVCRGPNRVGYVGGPSVDQAAQYFREIEAACARQTWMAELLKGGAQGIRWAPFPQVTFTNGSVMHGRSTVRDGVYLRGKGAHWVSLTEAAWINDAVYHQVVRALVLDRRGNIRLETTPNGGNYVFGLDERSSLQTRERWIKRDREAYYRAARATVYDNPDLDPLDISAIRAELPEWVWRTEYLAEFVEAGDAVFSWPLLVRLFDHDYPPLGKAFDAVHRYCIGVDLAQVSDYTAIVVLDITGAPPFRIAHWRRFRGVPYMGPGGVVDQVNALREAFNNARVYVDATSEKAVAESIAGAEGVVFTGPERTAMMSHLIVMAENEALALPARFSVLRDEMRALRRVRLAGGGVRADHPRDGYDDTVWALALACRGLRSGLKPAPPEVEAAFRQIQWWPSAA